MAGRTYLVDLDKKGVTVTVQADPLYILDMSGGIPLTPVLLSGAGQKVTLPVLRVRLRASSFIYPTIST